MKDIIETFIKQRPEMQFGHDNAKSKVQSLFGNTNGFAVGMGMGRKLGSQPSFMNATNRFGRYSFMRSRMGG